MGVASSKMVILTTALVISVADMPGGDSCYNIQVAVLAPLALLLVLEARCAHFVIAHFNYFVLWSSASLAPTQHIYKLVSEQYRARDCNWNSSAHVQGRRQLDLVSGLCNNPHRMRISGRFKGYFLSAHGEFISHRMKVVSSVVVCSQDFRDNLVFLPVDSAVASAHNGILRVACNAECPVLQLYYISRKE